MAARSEKGLAAYESEIRSLGVMAKGYSADLTASAEIRSVFEDIRADLGHPGVHVYNGGVWRERPAMQVGIDAFSHDLDLCITGALACAQAVYDGMKAAGRGTIPFTGGGLTLNPRFGARVTSLTAGKSGLRGLTYALAAELAADGIHVATVTVSGAIKAGTTFDPDFIADSYWNLHVQAGGEQTTEHVFDGSA